MPYTVQKVKGTTNVTVPIKVIDSTDGTPETGWDFEETGIDLWYQREGADHVSITEATQTAGGAHSDGGVVHISDGEGRLDLPDAACAIGTDGASWVRYGGTITGMVVIGGVVQLLDPVNKLFESQIVGDTGNDTTHAHVPGWTYGDDEINGYMAVVRDISESESFVVRLTDWVNSTKLATFTPALPASVQTDTDLIALLGKVDDRFTFTVAGNVDANVTHVNDTEVDGSGTEEDPWVPAA